MCASPDGDQRHGGVSASAGASAIVPTLKLLLDADVMRVARGVEQNIVASTLGSSNGADGDVAVAVDVAIPTLELVLGASRCNES